MFRRRENEVEVLLVHPGGPFFQNRDDGAWSIPKGEAAEGEDLLERAKVEFEEELGIAVAAQLLIDLGCVKQKGGKTVYAWAFEGNLPESFAIASNTFEMEWPPRSGNLQRFVEIDRAEFLSVEKARVKINLAQIAFLDRLVMALNSAKGV
jgi:predicted NUDIX family NTP pyrophosphohydrolase